jgi:hypothetical protein
MDRKNTINFFKTKKISSINLLKTGGADNQTDTNGSSLKKETLKNGLLLPDYLTAGNVRKTSCMCNRKPHFQLYLL